MPRIPSGGTQDLPSDRSDPDSHRGVERTSVAVRQNLESGNAQLADVQYDLRHNFFLSRLWWIDVIVKQTAVIRQTRRVIGDKHILPIVYAFSCPTPCRTIGCSFITTFRTLACPFTKKKRTKIEGKPGFG